MQDIRDNVNLKGLKICFSSGKTAMNGSQKGYQEISIIWDNDLFTIRDYNQYSTRKPVPSGVGIFTFYN